MTYYSTANRGQYVSSDTNYNEPYLKFLNYLLALPAASLPSTLFISYGDDEGTVLLSYAKNVCNLLSQLGARGVSILASSNDSDVGDTCQVDGKTSSMTAFPASCPWITTVAGTQETLLRVLGHLAAVVSPKSLDGRTIRMRLSTIGLRATIPTAGTPKLSNHPWNLLLL